MTRRLIEAYAAAVKRRLRLPRPGRGHMLAGTCEEWMLKRNEAPAEWTYTSSNYISNLILHYDNRIDNGDRVFTVITLFSRAIRYGYDYYSPTVIVP